jgi:predicted NBD/HSP70 family sugar kinase
VALGLDLRDGAATALAVDDEGRTLARVVVESRTELVPLTLEAVEAVARVSGGAASLGVSAAGPAVPPCSEVLSALARRDSGVRLSDRILPPGAAAAVAEAWAGAGRGVREVVLFSVAERASAGVVRDGRPVLGARGREMAVGWLALNPVEREDYRRAGCLDSEVGSVGIVWRLTWRIKSGDRSRVTDAAGGNLSAITVDQILDAARDGDGVSISVVRDTARYLGMAAANLVAMADPDMLVLGGIMASASDLLLDPVRHELVRRLPRAMVDALSIRRAELGADAAALGVAHAAAVLR